MDYVVLGFVAERPGYGYELSKRIDARMGPGWQFNPSAIYAALDRLKENSLIEGQARDVRSRERSERGRSERVHYHVTDDGVVDLEMWLRSKVRKEPVRESVVARLVVAGPEHASVLLEALEDYERDCLDILTSTTALDPPEDDPWQRLISDGVQDSMLQHLKAELSWVKSMRRRIESFDPSEAS